MRTTFLEWKQRLSRSAAAVAMAVVPGVAAAHVDYAVLFSGGWDADNNASRYYDQTLRMWNILTGTLGFNPTNIYVLFADGTYTGQDQCIGYAQNPDGTWSCNAHKDSDWSTVVAANTSVLMGTPGKLHDVLGFLDTAMTTDDSFYFWSFDHGAIEEGALAAFNIALDQFHAAVADRKAVLLSIPQNLQRTGTQFRAAGNA